MCLLIWEELTNQFSHNTGAKKKIVLAYFRLIELIKFGLVVKTILQKMWLNGMFTE